MPTVLDANGFQVRVLLPPREHGPPHVHVHKGGAEVVITLPDGEFPLAIRTIQQDEDRRCGGGISTGRGAPRAATRGGLTSLA